MDLKKPIPPCKGCDRRIVGDPETGEKNCHDTCDEYMNFRIALDEYNDKLNHLKGEARLPERRPWMAKFRKNNRHITEGEEK